MILRDFGWNPPWIARPFRGRGDLVAEITVETPTKLSKAQRELLEQFRETETGDECPESRGFFDRIKDAFGA